MDILPLLLMFGLLGVMMYFMTRRQRRAQEQQQALQNSLGVGDRVMTTSGLYGTVTDAEDGTTITLEIAPGVETEWLRAAVREKVGPVEETDDVEDLDDTDAVDEVETVDATTNEPPAVKDAELESGKK
ncbi:preprotein translocase subunit YajC [Actinophytocola algeriensis]|uniref:Preprotein translocase subunit YajC n=1 Tax=Actinophytocola algeriensis TaxID=1768010 RepID=A0A7W7VG29_9PSEU|nr:preprotein translocase subunit YajC [Actinophytocola algeriensis]MBB4908941.1 preprotein translocase subunit YajC [Actinophytocola algeriensis]MBE1474671.1 preprotein translocase subunit YajC [Actinophytocola algeriensis]